MANSHFKEKENFFFIFQVMIQKQNSHMSFSLYISALAVSDTVSLINGT